MNWLNTVLNSLCILLFFTTVVYAQPPQIQQGQPAPLDGLLFSLDYLQQTLDLLAEGANVKAQNESLKAQVSVLQEQIVLLKAAIEKLSMSDKAREEALIRADEREKLRDEMDKKFVLALQTNNQAIENLLKTNAQAQESLTQAQKHIQELEKQRTLSQIFGTLSIILGVVVGIFTGGAFF